MPADQTVNIKILPENAQGTFPLASASYLTLMTASRFLRPYPPGALRYQSTTYGTHHTFVLGNQTIQWNSRNRLTQKDGARLVRQDAADVAAESGTTYKVLVIIGASTVRTVSGITAQTFAYSIADRLSDGGAGAVTLKVFSNCNSLDSRQAPSLTFEMTGFGLGFGRGFGGSSCALSTRWRSGSCSITRSPRRPDHRPMAIPTSWPLLPRAPGRGRRTISPCGRRTIRRVLQVCGSFIRR
jgi:hypothetical protein